MTNREELLVLANTLGGGIGGAFLAALVHARADNLQSPMILYAGVGLVVGNIVGLLYVIAAKTRL